MNINRGLKQLYIGPSEDDYIARITYEEKIPGVWVIMHTNVDVSLRGQGIAQKLLDELVVFAKEENKQLYPVCSYAITGLNRNEEYKKLIYQGEVDIEDAGCTFD